LTLEIQMKFIGGTAAARKLFEELHQDGLLCMPYTDAWMKKNAKSLDTTYKDYKDDIGRHPELQGLAFIDTSRFHGDRLDALIDVFPAFSQIYRRDETMVNPDFIVLNLLTQKMIVFGLGRKDRVFTHIYRNGRFESVAGSTYDDYINQSFETVDDEGDIAVDPVFRYLQLLCSDPNELIDETYNSLEAFGIANFEYMSLPSNIDEIDGALREGPNADGVYEIDGEEMSEGKLEDLQSQHEELQAKCNRRLAFLQILFPKVEQGELATGAY
jgi:hypothetical protein